MVNSPILLKIAYSRHVEQTWEAEIEKADQNLTQQFPEPKKMISEEMFMYKMIIFMYEEDQSQNIQSTNNVSNLISNGSCYFLQ